MDPFQKITELLDSNNIMYEVFEHDPIVSVEQANKELGRPPEQGIKAMLLKTDTEFVLCAVKGSNKIDYKKVRMVLGVRKLRFATPEEVKEVMGVDVGACYPFGQLIGIKMLVDETLDENEWVVFSPGVHDKHIGMKWQDYKKVVDAKLTDIT